MAISQLILPAAWVLFLCSSYSLFDDCGVEASRVYRHESRFMEMSMPSQTYRTGYHFQPPKNWMNDPNGPMYYNGIYHLFYQHNPDAAIASKIVWGHSVSKDMISWIALEPAIYPSKLFDLDGCWSGSTTILPGNKPVIIYTGLDPTGRQVQNIALPKNLSDPYLIEWEKPDYNPLITPAMSDIDDGSFRDPTTAWQGSDRLWRMLIGSQKVDGSGEAILYRSKDFINWIKAKDPLHSVNGSGMWECPDFYPVPKVGRHGVDTSVIGSNVKHIFKVSLGLGPQRFDQYTVGRYLDLTDGYVPDNTSASNATGLRYDYGKFYASKTFFDAGKYRRILWAWINESDTEANSVARGWAGIQSIPRTVWLDANGRQLVQWPIAELESIRGKQVNLLNRTLNGGDRVIVGRITAAQADVEVHFDLPSLDKAETFDPSWVDPQLLCSQKGATVNGSIGPFGLLAMASESLDEYTAVFFRVFKAQDKPAVLMCSDQSRSSLSTSVDKTTYGGFVDIDLTDGRISLRSLMDHSIVESFGAGGKTCITARVYPAKAIGTQARLFSFNYGSEAVTISNLRAWSMGTPQINAES